MPKVGNKKFPYTPTGKKAAKAYAKAEMMEPMAEKRMELKKVTKKKKASMLRKKKG
jgi:hypothetical protein